MNKVDHHREETIFQYYIAFQEGIMEWSDELKYILKICLISESQFTNHPKLYPVTK